MTRRFGKGAILAGLFASLGAHAACGPTSTVISERDANRGGEAGTDDPAGGNAGTATGGGVSGGDTGGTSTAGVATGGASTGGSPTSGRGGAGASGRGGTGASAGDGGSGAVGRAGSGGLSGAAGAPVVEDCDPGSVRCRTHRERCSNDGRWLEEAFVCTTEVSGSTEFSAACAVKADGRLTCFGTNENDYYAEILRSTAPSGTFVDVDVADELSNNPWAACAIGPMGVTRCWGSSATYDAGAFLHVATSSYGTCGITDAGAIYCPTGSAMLHPPTDRGPFVDLDISNGHLLAVREDGSNYSGQPYDALPQGNYVQVSAGGDSACGVRDDGTLGCNSSVVIPESIASTRFTRVAVEYYRRICGILDDGGLACFRGRPDVPEFTPPAGTFVRITAAGNGMCAIRSAGSLTCWGDAPMVPPDDW